MKFLKDDYIIAFWFASNKNKDNAQYILIKRDNEYIFEFRMRYSKSDDPFSNKDEKNFYSYSIDSKEKSEKEVIELINLIFVECIKNGYDDIVDHFLVHGDRMKFLEIAKTKDYIHIKTKKVH